MAASLVAAVVLRALTPVKTPQQVVEHGGVDHVRQPDQAGPIPKARPRVESTTSAWPRAALLVGAIINPVC